MTTRVRVLLSLAVVAATVFLANCGHYVCGATFGASSCTSTGGGIGTGGNANGTVFAYLLAESYANPPGMAADRLDLASNSWAIQGSSSFTPPPLPLVPVTDGGTAVVSGTSQKYLYIPFNDSTVWGYAIDGTTGALTPVTGNPASAAGGTSIAADPAGRFLFVGDSATGDITAFTINPADGALTVVPGSPFSTGILAAQLATDGQGKFLYATAGSTQVAAMSITQSTGALAAVTGSPFSLGFPMAQIQGEKSGKFLLGISGSDAHIHVFQIDTNTGGFGEVVGSPFSTVSVPVNLVVHPTGKFVYSLNGAGTPMEAYQIGTSGNLTAVTGSPFTSVMLDEGQFDQSGLFLFGVGAGHLGAPTFAPYPTNTSSGAVSVSQFSYLGFPGAGFAVSDLTNAP